MVDRQWQPIMAFGLVLSAWVAGPIIIGYVIGSWIDRRFGTEPWWLLGCIGIAFVISNVGIVREAKKLLKQIDTEESKVKEKKSDDNQ